MVKDNVLLCSEHSQRISNESQFVQVSSERIFRLNARKTCTSLYWSLTLSLCNSRKDNKFKIKILSRTVSFMPLAFISNFQELKNIHSYAHSASQHPPHVGVFVWPRSPVLAPVSGVNTRLTLHNWSRIPAPCPHTWARPNCQQQCLRLSQEPRRAPNCLQTTVCLLHCLLLIHNGFWVTELAETLSEQLSNDKIDNITAGEWEVASERPRSI